jgi:hypothetical protein
MRTRREFYSENRVVYGCEMDECPICSQALRPVYTSGWKTIQTLHEVITIAQQPKRCTNLGCCGNQRLWKSVQWQQIAPIACTYGYDVIAQIGWQRQMQRQTFSEIHLDLQSRVCICETEVRAIYHQRYLPLRACHERQEMDRLKGMVEQGGLRLSLDGMAPEGGEAQLWLVRELQSGIVLRSGWMSQQDQGAFVNFLQPIAALGWPVTAVLSDKQRGLVPAVAEVFPNAKHAFCQIHYLNNAAEPVSEADEAMKINLRQGVRQEIGALIRQEKVEMAGVLTVTGGIPSPVVPKTVSPDPLAQEQDDIIQDLRRRIRYLLTLKGRPPFCLAGIAMFERLTEIKECLERLMAKHSHPQLAQLHQGLQSALQAAQTDYTLLRQAANWLEQIADLLDPEEKPQRSADQVQQALFAYLQTIQPISENEPGLLSFFHTIQKTTLSYASGLFHSYNIPGLPRTNNQCESTFRDLNRRLLRTTGQKGLTRRIIQRTGAWELLPRPDSFQDTIQTLKHISPQDFQDERQRFRQHRDRFRLHTRSEKQSHAQLNHLEYRWANLPANSP